jgi:Uri superfamily endonuclease
MYGNEMVDGKLPFDQEQSRPSLLFKSKRRCEMKGVYILLFRITRDLSKCVGSLGKIQFEKGNYAYVGSAQSSLFPRLERHYARRKKLHWHIDYLTTSKNIEIKRAICSPADSKEFECLLSRGISELPFSKAITYFGSSDCENGCKSHLFVVNSTLRHALTSIAHIYRKLHLKPFEYLSA